MSPEPLTSSQCVLICPSRFFPRCARGQTLSLSSPPKKQQFHPQCGRSNVSLYFQPPVGTTFSHRDSARETEHKTQKKGVFVSEHCFSIHLGPFFLDEIVFPFIVKPWDRVERPPRLFLSRAKKSCLHPLFFLSLCGREMPAKSSR